MESNTNGESLAAPQSTGLGSGLYVDMENLQQSGEGVIQRLIETWPLNAPPPSHLSLFVQADQVELWRMWAASRFPHLGVYVSGTQHFSKSSSKNSADIALATKAMADWMLKRVNHIVVFSDDSDFVSLYAAIRENSGDDSHDGNVPFSWVVTDRKSSLSTTITRFFPPDKLHVIAMQSDQDKEENGAEGLTGTQRQVPSADATATWETMAQAVAHEILVGTFKSTECQPIIKSHWPSHPIAEAGGAAFGTEFKNNIWPILQSYGVVIDNPGGKPVRYRMTQAAKDAVN